MENAKQEEAKKFVRRVLKDVFRQTTDAETVEAVALKVAEAIPARPPKQPKQAA